MISFNLICDSDHEFEGWFQNSASFDEQRAKKRVECPICGSRKVQKALSAPNIATSRSKAAASKEKASKMVAAQKQMVAMMRDHVKENCDYVGTEFAEEARKIHYGESEDRGIYGESSPEEAKELVEEGISVTPIPWIEETSEH